jgi:hypothetical protein
MNIVDQLEQREKAGDVGIEIEVEFDSESSLERARENTPSGWTYTSDGSLRGYATEFILRQPCKPRKLSEYINRIYDNALDFDDIVDSDNCSTHVHINCQRLTLQQLVNFICVYSILEPILIDWCGEHRKGNLFCLSMLEAEDQFFTLSEVVGGRIQMIQRDRAKYAALNMAALNQYGSLEFRSMRFPIPKDTMESWASMLLRLREYACTFDTAPDILMRYSEFGLDEFLREALPEHHELFNVTSTLREEVTETVYRVQAPAHEPVMQPRRQRWSADRESHRGREGFYKFDLDSPIPIGGPSLRPRTRVYMNYVIDRTPMNHSLYTWSRDLNDPLTRNEWEDFKFRVRQCWLEYERSRNN